jgi:ATP-binding cassette subfamily B (MDR/TAP) protein 1
LDSFNEKKVQDALDKMMKDKTTVTVAHRINTIKNSDCIFVFEQGRIVEEGSYESLVEKKSHFYKLEKGVVNI